MRRVQAFTLFEVLISMLLVVILGALATYTLGGPLRDLTDAGGSSERQLATLLFAQRVQADLEKASTITAAGEGAIMMVGSDGAVRYEQRGDTLVRSAMDGEHALSALRSMEVTEVPGAPGLIEVWSVQVDDPATAGPLVFRKDYDARTIIRYLIDHGDTVAHVP